MAGFDYSIHPFWKFLKDNYSFEETFHFFGPYTGASVRAHRMDADTIRVEMPLLLNNLNIVGTHFGGSLYSMTDPWFMFLLMEKLGNEYIVWDKSARIDFLRPGRSTVSAVFYLPDSEAEHIRELVSLHRKTIKTYIADIIDADGNLVAKVEKEIYIRRALGFSKEDTYK